ncbi:Subtilase family protein [Bacillus sp. OV166]|uniref:S8 family serine peptidase n=1 Tax=Bacillus sp. OV166 TaxID=1882763 RepID=UPI000A2ABF12|nr:S8 family serine peptidase [Bacillus sp. OV166]SMQ78418.1 Subtilase family protein [Bacillus sp. OV166]
MFETKEIITPENVGQFHNNPDLVDLAVKKLKSAGFDVLQIGPTSINIAAPAEIYDKVFQTKIVPKEREVIRYGKKTLSTFLDTTDTPLSGFIDTSKSSLADVLEGVALNEPMYYFQIGSSALADRHTENTIPPQVDQFHLSVPDDVARLLRADRVHNSGITGNGVKVVMVDTGWYRHPYFEHQGYRSTPVVLGVGARNPEDDEYGHGTGESANLFAVAPGITFTMVKQGPAESEDQVMINGAAEINIASSLSPDIISCSWGLSFRDGSLTPPQKAIAAAIANAVKKGIIVVFSAGNGHYGFPGQLPYVISAGGVYIDEDGKLQASDYASGFESKLFPSREVPDVCGLVGMQPRAQYIMLPVQPGDTLDEEESKDEVDRNGNVHREWGNDGTAPNDGWGMFSGTSAAAPQIAGICALLKQVKPNLTFREAKDILTKTAIDIVEGQSSQGNSAGPGRDLATGFGLADAERAVQMVREGR